MRVLEESLPIPASLSSSEATGSNKSIVMPDPKFSTLHKMPRSRSKYH